MISFKFTWGNWYIKGEIPWYTSVISAAVSYYINRSIMWAVIHGCCSLFYLMYLPVKYLVLWIISLFS